MREYILEINNLCKSFGVTKANQDISLKIKPGEIRAFAGENGSGKSTLISQIVGIYPSDSGEILFDGKPFAPQSPIDAHKAGIGFVVQELGLVDDFNAGMNMFLGNLQPFKHMGVISTRKLDMAAKKELEKWNLGEVPMHEKAVNMSIEKRKIVEITKALSINPKVLILDETTQSLSHDTKHRLYKIIEEQRKQGVAIIFITHDLEEMCKLSDSITILRDGKVVQTLEKNEIELSKVRNLMVGRKVEADYYRSDKVCHFENEVVLKVDHISDRNAYEDVSFELHKGEILGFCGLSDAGIHDIGKAIFALQPPQKGSITIPSTGKQIRKPLDATRSKMAYVPKDRDSEALMMDAPIRDNVYMPSVEEIRGKMFFISPGKCTSLAEQAKKQLSIKCTNIGQIVSSLSGGNKQKVNLGRWLVKDLNILILDCPTRGVDVGVKAYIYKLMKEMKDQGLSILLISDELTEIIGMSDRVIIMKDGRITGTIERDENLTENKVVEVMI